jgi:hypothetical protein
MNAFRFITPTTLLLRGIKEKSIPYSKTFNYVKTTVLFECDKNAVYNIRRYTFPYLEKLVIMNDIEEYEHSFLKYEYYEKPPFNIYLRDNTNGKKSTEQPIFHNPYYNMNSSRFMTPQQYEYVKRICNIRRSYYNF